jgi:hypothetical protein
MTAPWNLHVFLLFRETPVKEGKAFPPALSFSLFHFKFQDTLFQLFIGRLSNHHHPRTFILQYFPSGMLLLYTNTKSKSTISLCRQRIIALIKKGHPFEVPPVISGIAEMQRSESLAESYKHPGRNG